VTGGYDGLPVVVAGAGVSGAAAARALRAHGARVTVVDRDEQRAAPLREDGFPVLATDVPPPGTALLVTSPGWRPDAPLLVTGAAAGIEVIGEVELAWRLAQERARQPGALPPAPWLAVTGTNGKTTTVRMLASMLSAAGHRTVATGNVGLPVLDAVLGSGGRSTSYGAPYDVLAVELSSFQLHWSRSLRPHTAVVLNLAPDHVDWHGSFAAYAAAKGRIHGPGTVAVYNREDELSVRLSASAPVRAGFTLGTPRLGELGVVEDLLVDRAFPTVPGEATELGALADVPVPGPHNVANALAAAALARSYGVPAEAVRAGLRAFAPDPHRNALVATVGGVAWVDDSKATNPHAAAASLAAYPQVVWVAGGLLKGAEVDELVRQAAPRLRGVVLLGTDRAPFLDALRRHAPQIPVREVDRLDTEAMSAAVATARSLARPGDTVLLAPAAASMDCFRDYAERGELFAAAAGALTEPPAGATPPPGPGAGPS
jgi:UDP-N-acetylmuramoylalanine--D-glutamate ligase